MINDYELFLEGCYSAIVEINKNNKDLYNFIDLMKNLGWKDYANYLEKLEDEKGIYYLAQCNNIKDLCFEFQIGKGFTFGDKKDYLNNCKETKILLVNDLIKATGYKKNYLLDYTEILLSQLGNCELDILDEFCCDYDWQPIKCSSGYNIIDSQLCQMVEDKCYDTFNELINRIVGRAIDYLRDEMSWEEENKEEIYSMGIKLLEIAKKYKNDDKWEEKWLNNFEKELKKIK